MRRPIAVFLLAATAACSSAEPGTNEHPAKTTGESTSATAGAGGAAAASTTSAGGAAGTGTTTGAGGATGAGGGSPTVTGVDPSNGSGGPLGPGQTGTTPLGATIRIPPSYDPEHVAAPVIWLFNEPIAAWSAIADADGVVLVDLAEYNDVQKIVDKLNETQTILEQGYEVDRARYYWAGWSAGGNIAIIAAAQNQDVVAGTLVFPGTGGSYAAPAMQQNQGHKIRLFYACGDQDPNYSWSVVENEANVFASYGYTTKFVKVVGAAHELDEGTTGIRATAWAWMKGFNLKN